MNEIGLSLDTVWMLLAAMLVFFMQPGFALCEAGFTEHCEHPDEELCRFHVRLTIVLLPRLRIHVRQRGRWFHWHA